MIKCLGISTIYWSHINFYGHFLDELYGMLEVWNIGIMGMKSGKRANLQEMLNLRFLMMPPSHNFSVFFPIKYPIKI